MSIEYTAHCPKCGSEELSVIDISIFKRMVYADPLTGEIEWDDVYNDGDDDVIGPHVRTLESNAGPYFCECGARFGRNEIEIREHEVPDPEPVPESMAWYKELTPRERDVFCKGAALAVREIERDPDNAIEIMARQGIIL